MDEEVAGGRSVNERLRLLSDEIVNGLRHREGGRTTLSGVAGRRMSFGLPVGQECPTHFRGACGDGAQALSELELVVETLEPEDMDGVSLFLPI